MTQGFLRAAVLLSAALLVMGSLWSPTGDGSNGWATGDDVTATNMTELQTSITDTTNDLAAVGLFAHDYTSGSSTAGIQEAAVACGKGAVNGHGCRILLDCGAISVTDQIVIGDGDTPSNTQNNITIQGCGGNAGGFGENATRITYAGANVVGSGTAVFRMAGLGHELKDFGVNGQGLIDHGVIWEGDSDGGGNQTIFGKMTSLHVEGYALSGAYFKTMGAGRLDQVDFIRITNVDFEDNIVGTSTGDYCIIIDVPFTSMNKMDGISCGYSVAGILMNGGSLDLENSTFATNTGDCQLASNCYAISVAANSTVPVLSLFHNHFEVGEGAMIKGPNGTTQGFTMGTLMDNTFLISEVANRAFLTWDAVGRLTIIGNLWTNGVAIGTGADGDRSFSIQCDANNCTGANADNELIYTWLGNSVRAYGTGTITQTVDITDPIVVESF